MSLARTADLVASALADSGAVVAFNVVGLEHAEGIIAGAEHANAPVILQLSENSVAFHGGLAPIGRACLEAAAAAAIPVAVHLDHATTEALCSEALMLGFSSVMFDASASDYAANVAATARVAQAAHRSGAFVESELGAIGGKDGVHAPGARTDPSEAAAYVAATDIDALAVAIGTSHAMIRKEANLDFALLQQLRETVPVPLVLHGSSGVTDDDLRRAVSAGIVKVNVGTQLNLAFTGAIRSLLDDRSVDPRPLLNAGRQAIATTVSSLLELLSVSSAA